MKIKAIIQQDIVNYKKTSMFIGTNSCCFKCCKQIGENICLCQNSPIAKHKTINVSNKRLIDRYVNNKLTHAIVFGGLQPFQQFDQILSFIKDFRQISKDDVVIYTGYYQNELQQQINQLKQFKNIVIKFGRFVPNQKIHYDQLLGVNLASDNQHAIKIS